MIEYILRGLAAGAALLLLVLLMPLTIFKQNPNLVPAIGLICVVYLLYYLFRKTEYR